MNSRRFVHCFLLLLAVLALEERAYGGKLGGIRASAKGKSKSAAPHLSNSRAVDKDDAKDESNHAEHRSNQREDTQSRTSHARNQASSPGKLSGIRVAAAHPGHTQTPRAPARSHRGRSRRPHDGHHGGFNFYSHYSTPVCLPTVVEEHHFYEPQPVIIENPVIVSAAPPIEYEQETVVTRGDPFEIVSPPQVRFEIDYATDEADVDRAGFGLLLNATEGLGIDTSVRIFREADADFRDHLWLGDFNVVYELFPTEFVRTRAGVGANWLADRYGAEAGFNLTVGTDLFAGPLVLSGEADLGTLGDADLFHGRITAAIRQGDHVEWFAGYDFLDIGGTEIRGAVGGLRFRF